MTMEMYCSQAARVVERAEACERAILHAWLLARAHGHHWAVDATPLALEYGRACIAHDRARAELDWVLEDPKARQEGLDRAERRWRDAERKRNELAPVYEATCWRSLSPEDVRRLAAEGRLSIAALTGRLHLQEGIPPRTVEEARALSAIPGRHGFPKIGFNLFHVTGTGRVAWQVHPRTGAVAIQVYRPSGRCLAAWISEDLSRVDIEVGPQMAHSRHVEALNKCLWALGVDEIDPDNQALLGCDQYGCTPSDHDVEDDRTVYAVLLSASGPVYDRFVKAFARHDSEDEAREWYRTYYADVGDLVAVRGPDAHRLYVGSTFDGDFELIERDGGA